jgi:drug/metabolite transporter (DMT)-like permease
VSAALWAVASGVGFGLFQSLNRRALLDIDDAYVSTFLNLAIASLVLVVVAVSADDVSRLVDADAWALAAFAGAGIVHFLLGWTFLNLSQRRIGAARTSPLLTMSPVFALVVAAIAVGQFPDAVALVAIVPMVLGAYLVAGGGSEARGADALPGLACALMWGVSPVLTIKGLDGLDAPLLGVTLGMVASTAAYGLFLAGRSRSRPAWRSRSRRGGAGWRSTAPTSPSCWRSRSYRCRSSCSSRRCWSAATSSASRARSGSGPRSSSAAPSP